MFPHRSEPSVPTAGAVGTAEDIAQPSSPPSNRVKRLATGLLIAMTLVFIIATVIERRYEWVTIVRVTAEASMIGALADWFAVTALFRHPLGIPIPHTAIIPRRKDQIGRTLASFVQTSFLTKDNVTERVRMAEPASRIGTWLADPINVEQATRQITEGLAALASSLDDEKLGPALQEIVIERLRTLDVAGTAASLLAGATSDGRHQTLVDGLVPVAHEMLEANKEALEQAIRATSPRWVPGAVDHRVLERVLEVAHRYVDDVAADPAHPFRRHIDTVLDDVTERLRHDPELATRANELRDAALNDPAVQRYLAGLWQGARSSIVDQANDPHSALRNRIQSALAEFGQRLRTNRELRVRIDTWTERIAGEVADRFQGEISELVTTTVERWDARETSDRLESLIGRDLQFIRINGTVVGGLAGLTIHLLSRLIA